MENPIFLKNNSGVKRSREIIEKEPFIKLQHYDLRVLECFSTTGRAAVAAGRGIGMRATKSSQTVLEKPVENQMP